MLKDAPADIRDELEAVLDAVAASRAKADAGSTPLEMVKPLYEAKIRPAFDAVNKDDCAK